MIQKAAMGCNFTGSWELSCLTPISTYSTISSMNPVITSPPSRRQANAHKRKQTLGSIVRVLTRELPRLTAEYGIQSLGVFGSFVRGDEREDSDLDVLAKFKLALTFAALTDLEQELTQLLGIKVQVILNSSLYRRPYFGRNVLGHIIWLQKDGLAQTVNLNQRPLGDSMEPKREYLDYIQDMITSMQNALQFVENVAFPQMLADRKTLAAVSYEIMIIGEAASKIPSDVRALYPALDWRNIIGIRNRLAHDYGKIDYEKLWTILHEEIPNDLMFLQDVFEQEKKRRNLPDLEPDEPTA